MSKIFILNVENGATYEGAVYDFWIKCKLENNIELFLFDYKRLNIERFTNKWIDAEIQTLFIQKNADTDLICFEGEIVSKNNLYYFKNNYITIEISEEDIESEKLEMNTISKYYFGRLDIVRIIETKGKNTNLI